MSNIQQESSVAHTHTADLIEETAHPHIYALAYMLAHGEPNAHAHFPLQKPHGYTEEDLVSMDKMIRAKPFSVLVHYAANMEVPVAVGMDDIHAFMVNLGLAVDV